MSYPKSPGDPEAHRALAARNLVLVQERDEARKFAEEACAKYNALITRGPVLTCAFCGWEYAAGTPATGHAALTAHVMECEKHPLVADRKRLDYLENEMRVEQAWQDSDERDAPMSLFRKNVPITRAAIDEAMQHRGPQPGAKL